MRVKILILMMVLLFTWPYAQSQAKAIPGEKSLTVVATFSLIGDFVREVGKDRVELTVLVGPDNDVHAYEPLPRDSITLGQAAVVFKNGAGLDDWVDRLAKASGDKVRIVALTDGISLMTLGGQSSPEAAPDPHVWQDVRLAIRMVENIQKQLSMLDPRGAEIYSANSREYISRLRELDASLLAQIAKVPPMKRKMVTSHDTFGYFARRYGFQIVGTAMGASTDAAEPSALELTRLVQTIRREKVGAVFTENMHNPDLIQNIARETGIAVVTTLYTDALGPADSTGATYIRMMEFNVQQIVEALK